MKRYLALLLVLCMLLPLAACGEKTPAPQPTTPATPTEPATPAEPTPADPAAPTEPTAPASSEPEEYVFASHLPLVDPAEKKTLTIGLPVNALTTDYENNDYTLWLEEMTGIDLKFVTFAGTSSDVATQVALMVASGESLPDILLHFTGISKTQGGQYGDDGAFVDLTDYFHDPDMTYYFRWAMELTMAGQFITAEDVIARAVTPSNGKIYNFPKLENCPEDNPKSHVSINQLWLDKLNLKAPTTVDELYNVLVAFRDGDPNGNGVKDEIPLMGINGGNFRDVVHWIMNAFVFVNDSYWYNITDGKLWAPYTTDEYRQALIFIKKLVDEGLLAKQTWTMTSSELKSLLNPSDGVYKVGIIGADVYLDYVSTSNSIFDYTQLGPLADATGKGGYGPVAECTINNYTFISSDCKEPELAFKLLDFMCAPEAHLYMRWGKEGVDWEYAAPGATGNLGGEAKYKLLGEDPFTTSNNKIWHIVDGIASSVTNQQEVDLSDPTDWYTARTAHDRYLIDSYAQAGQPDEVFYFALYTDEEVETRADFVSDLTSYIKKARGNFCNGNIDPSSDKDWNDYLDTLKSLRIDEWISIGQTAYDRTFGK